MTAIPFTQYLRPNGRASAVAIDRPEPVASLALAVIAKGYRFECEVLTTGDVSLTIHDPVEEEDVAIEVVPNGIGVPAAVDRLISQFSERTK